VSKVELKINIAFADFKTFSFTILKDLLNCGKIIGKNDENLKIVLFIDIRRPWNIYMLWHPR